MSTTTEIPSKVESPHEVSTTVVKASEKKYKIQTTDGKVYSIIEFKIKDNMPTIWNMIEDACEELIDEIIPVRTTSKIFEEVLRLTEFYKTIVTNDNHDEVVEKMKKEDKSSKGKFFKGFSAFDCYDFFEFVNFIDYKMGIIIMTKKLAEMIESHLTESEIIKVFKEMGDEPSDNEEHVLPENSGGAAAPTK